VWGSGYFDVASNMRQNYGESVALRLANGQVLLGRGVLLRAPLGATWRARLKGFGDILRTDASVGDLTLLNERGESGVISIVRGLDDVLEVEGRGPWPFGPTD
jgi:hypothetical protein